MNIIARLENQVNILETMQILMKSDGYVGVPISVEISRTIVDICLAIESIKSR